MGLLASAVALALACGQSAFAETETAEAAPAAEAQTSPAPAADTTTSPGAEGRARAEQRQAEAMEERSRRYEDLRERAAEVGLDLPETPPWEQGMPQMPEMPMMPEMPEMPGMSGMPAPMSFAERNAVRDERYADLRERAAEAGIELPEVPIWNLSSAEERKAYMETMRDLTTEQRRTLHKLRWEAMRSRAAERGMELPEQAPWEERMKEREAQQERWESYRETVEAMTDEQREAAAAIYGRSPFPADPSGEPFGTAPGKPFHGPMMPPCGGPSYDQGVPPFGPGYYRGPVAPYGSGY